jgi:hypothetical protein
LALTRSAQLRPDGVRRKSTKSRSHEVAKSSARRCSCGGTWRGEAGTCGARRRRVWTVPKGSAERRPQGYIHAARRAPPSSGCVSGPI